MSRLKITAAGDNQKRILEYLEENASDDLVERINEKFVSLDPCWQYILKQARKKASNNVAMVEDVEVYGWAVHYFEEAEETHQKALRVIETQGAAVELTSGKNGDSGLRMKGSPNVREIREAKKTLDRMEAEATGKDVHPDKPVKAPKPEKKEPQKAVEGQMSLFDIFGAMEG